MTAVKTTVFNRIRKIFTYRPFERILFSFIRGSKYLGYRSKVIPGPHLYRFNSIRNVSRNGVNYSLDMSCMMQWYVFWDFKSNDREKLYSLVQKEDIIFDVGTNIGETLLNFARLTGSEGFVYGFEPDEENYSNVQRNISLNTFKNVHVFKNAVSDKKEQVKLYCIDPHNRGRNRILEHGNDTGDKFVMLETTTIDEVVNSNGIQKIDLIKIDIEGYEMHALKGAEETLRRLRPKLFIEVGYTRLIENKTSPDLLVAFLEKLGYKLFDSQTENRITSGYDFSYLADGGIDIYAIPE